MNISKKKFVKEIFFEVLKIVKKCMNLPKYKILNETKRIILEETEFVLMSTFPKKLYFVDKEGDLEENGLFPTGVFIFDEKNKYN